MKRYSPLYFLLLTAVCFCTAVQAELRHDQTFKYWQILDSKNLSLREIQNIGNANWVPIPDGTTDISFLDEEYWTSSQEQTLWIKIELPRRITDRRLWMELIPNVGLDGQLAIFENEQWTWRLPVGRQAGKYAQLPSTFLTFIIDNPRTHRVAYLKLNTSQIFHFSINIKTNEEHLSHIAKNNLFNGAVFGLLLLAIIYNLALGISAGEKLYLFYSAYVLSTLLYLLASTGYLRFAFPDWGGNGSFQNLTVLLAIFAAIAFIRQLLDTKNSTPKIDMLLRIQQAALFISIFLIGFVPNWLAYLFAESLGVIAPIIALVAGISAWRKGHPLALYFLLAWTLFLIGSTLWGWMWLGIIEPSLLTLRLFLIGSVTEAMLLSLLLGYRYSQLKRQTETLSADKSKFKTLSDTDPLTGIYNRHGLFKKIEQMFGASKQNLMWLEINIDKFQQFNEIHGHIVSDKLLTEFGQILKSKVRRDNLAAKLIDKENSYSYRRGVAGRVNGGQFTVLLSNCSLPQARLYAERIMRDFENIHIKSPEGASPSATVSIGIICVSQGDEFHNTWKKANEILQQAKLKGSRQICIG